MTSTRIDRKLNAPRPSVYQALLDPSGVAPSDNELDWRMSFSKLASLVETS